MMDMFNEVKDSSISAPSMMPGVGTAGGFDPSQYNYRIEYFQMGGTETQDDQSAIEALLSRSIDGSGDVVIVERKDSISATTGMYTMIIIYMEKRIGEHNA